MQDILQRCCAATLKLFQIMVKAFLNKKMPREIPFQVSRGRHRIKYGNAISAMPITIPSHTLAGI
jgi:hypothetical protein